MTDTNNSPYTDSGVIIERVKNTADPVRKTLSHMIDELELIANSIEADSKQSNYFSRWDRIAADAKIAQLRLALLDMSTAYQSINKAACN